MDITTLVGSPAHIVAAARAGFDGVQLNMPGHTAREQVLSGEGKLAVMERYRLVRALGMRVGQTHLVSWPSHIPPAGDGSYEAQAELLMPMLEREIEWTAEMGCRVAVTHPFFVQDGERQVSRAGNVRMIEALLPTLERCGVTLALENIYGLNASDAHHELAEDMLYYTERFDTPYLALCLDAGHAVIRRQNPIALAQAFGDRLGALHLHASIARGDNHGIPGVMNGDAVNWSALGATLGKIGYRGDLNLEIKPPSTMPPTALERYFCLAWAMAREIAAAVEDGKHTVQK